MKKHPEEQYFVISQKTVDGFPRSQFDMPYQAVDYGEKLVENGRLNNGAYVVKIVKVIDKKAKTVTRDPRTNVTPQQPTLVFDLESYDAAVVGACMMVYPKEPQPTGCRCTFQHICGPDCGAVPKNATRRHSTAYQTGGWWIQNQHGNTVVFVSDLQLQALRPR